MAYPRPISQAVRELAERNGYWTEVKATVRRRGWPERSAKPYLLYQAGGAFLSAFASEAALERNLRARAGL